MHLLDYIVLSLIIGWISFAVYFIVKRKKRGGTTCGSCASGCAGCAHSCGAAHGVKKHENS